jgi:hypothetical protein
MERVLMCNGSPKRNKALVHGYTPVNQKIGKVFLRRLWCLSHQGVRIYIKPGVRWVWWGGFVLALGAILSMFDKRYRKLPKLADISERFEG